VKFAYQIGSNCEKDLSRSNEASLRECEHARLVPSTSSCLLRVHVHVGKSCEKMNYFTYGMFFKYIFVPGYAGDRHIFWEFSLYICT